MACSVRADTAAGRVGARLGNPDTSAALALERHLRKDDNRGVTVATDFELVGREDELDRA